MELLPRLFVLVIIAVAGVQYTSSKSDVITLTPKNFDKLVIRDRSVWMVDYYAPWCTHCRALQPEYEKAAKVLKGIVKFGAIDADKHDEFRNKYDIVGYPTIKIFAEDKTHPIEYKKGRTATALVDGAIEAVRQRAQAALG